MERSYRPLAATALLDRVLLLTHAAVAVLAGFILLPMVWAQQPPQPTGREMVDAFHAAFGAHHERAVHAKGTIVTGSFVADPAASQYTAAAHLQPSLGTLKVIARFSDFTGIPDIPDSDPNSRPKGFAIRFLLPDGEATDVVTHNFNGFPTSTAAEFAVMLRAIGAARSTPPDPEPLNRFLATHPTAKAFVAGQKPVPASWATTPYFGVNTFRFTNAAGQSNYIRYRFVPLGGESYLTPEQTRDAAPDYLSQELASRLADGSIRFRMEAQVADAGDDTQDPAKPWPTSRKTVQLGVVTLTAIVPGEQASRNLQFQPGAVLPGIETADAMLDVRKPAYPISGSERQ